MVTYAAFLRGINVGGYNTVSMPDLRKAFEHIGFKKVNTILVSGNVVFESKKGNLNSLAQSIERQLEHTFGSHFSVMVFTIVDIQKLIKANLFKEIKVTPQTRLYITFLAHPVKIRLKHNWPDEAFRILAIKNRTVFSVLDLSKTGTTQSMNVLEKIFGRNITTRNWNTILKINTIFSHQV